MKSLDRDGTWRKINAQLGEQVRLQAGRNRFPSVSSIDNREGIWLETSGSFVTNMAIFRT